MRARYPSAVGTDRIRNHTISLVSLAERHPLDLRVPTCGDWTLGDLVWHLTEVQSFWVHVIGNRPAGPDTYDEPDRPAEAELPGLLRQVCARLVSELDAADAAEPAWSWSDDHTVGFTVRRQTHEAVIHHLDGVLAAGEPLPDIDPLLAADGIDELVTVMLTGVPDWAEYAPSDTSVLLTADDTEDAWPLGLGRMTGTSPDTGTTYDLLACELLDHVDRPSATISAPAHDLVLWMWGRRGLDTISVQGDQAVAEHLRAMVAEATQ